MQKKQLSKAEIDAFKEACQDNGIKITQKPQKKVKSATIIIGKHGIALSKDLKVARRTRIKDISNTPK